MARTDKMLEVMLSSIDMAKKLKNLDQRLLENLSFNACLTLIKNKKVDALTKYYASIMNQITSMDVKMKLVLFVLEWLEKPIATKIIQKASTDLYQKVRACPWRKERLLMEFTLSCVESRFN